MEGGRLVGEIMKSSLEKRRDWEAIVDWCHMLFIRHMASVEFFFVYLNRQASKVRGGTKGGGLRTIQTLDFQAYLGIWKCPQTCDKCPPTHWSMLQCPQPKVSSPTPEWIPAAGFPLCSHHSWLTVHTFLSLSWSSPYPSTSLKLGDAALRFVFPAFLNALDQFLSSFIHLIISTSKGLLNTSIDAIFTNLRGKNMAMLSVGHGVRKQTPFFFYCWWDFKVIHLQSKSLMCIKSLKRYVFTHQFYNPVIYLKKRTWYTW